MVIVGIALETRSLACLDLCGEVGLCVEVELLELQTVTSWRSPINFWYVVLFLE